MSHKELIENIVMLLEEVEKLEQLEKLLTIYSDFFNKDNITSLIGALAEAMYFQNHIGSKESVKIKTEYRDLINKLQKILQHIS